MLEQVELVVGQPLTVAEFGLMLEEAQFVLNADDETVYMARCSAEGMGC